MDKEQLKALASECAKDIKTEKDLSSFMQQLMKLTMETALNAELSEHLGYEKHQKTSARRDEFCMIGYNLRM